MKLITPSKLIPLMALFAVPVAHSDEEQGATKHQDYLYRPVGTGIEIQNGERRFNRPLYSSVERPHRLIAMTGDRPEYMLMRISSTKNMSKLTNLKLGLADGPWLDELTPVLARYDAGVQHHRVGRVDAGIEIDAVRAITSEGLLLRVRCDFASPSTLVLALGGTGSSNYDQNPRAAAFTTKGNTPAFADNVLTLSGGGATVFATGSAPLAFRSADPATIGKGPKAMLDSSSAQNGVATLAAMWPQDRELYFILTTDKPDSESVRTFRANPAKAFAAAVADNRSLATAVSVDTPDPYLNAALPSQMLAYNAAWSAPTFRHGAIAWHDSYAGWRSVYAGSTAGWHDRVQSHMQAFYRKQGKSGRIPSKLGHDGIYNMGEVLVDQAIFDYECTGDLDPLRNGGFDAIARHLAWGENYIKTPDGLYENFLNAWNTDYKWCNGGGSTIASAYYWRANRAMAEIAGRLGKSRSVFDRRADEIAAAMKESLWSERVGVYGEYRDRFGLQLLHESPDLSSIYTPIDLGFCDQFEAYRMLRFALRRFETVRDLPRGGALIYSSEWLPNHYSTRDIYTAEIINTLLALYQTGQAEAAEPFRRAIDGSCFAGPGPGSTGYVTNPNGTYKPHTDFTDTTSMYVRNVVEGLFGVRMNAPERRLTLQPCFPKAWDQASIQCPFVDYQYSWDGTAETMVIKAPNGFGTTIRLRARRAEIASVTVNGRPAEFSTQPGVGCAWVTVPVPAAAGARVQVVYGKEALPQAEFVATGTPGQSFTVRVDRGRIKQVRLSRSALDKVTVSDDGKACVIPLPPEAGVPTFFVRVAHGNTESWVPVEVDVRLAESVAGTPAKEDATNVTAHTVDLSRFHNQRLADLHKNKFEPLITPFYWANREGLRTIQSNGRIWWEGHAKHGARPNTTTLASANGRFTTDNGIPFDVPASGEDSVFTTRYENFPNSVEIPVNLRGRKVCFLIAASIPLAQSRMENGRITVKLGDGTGRVLTLRNPESIDDWLGSGKGQPYVQSGKAQSLGNATHAVLQELDLGEQMTIKSVTLETRTEETMIGLLGITVIQEGESK